MFAKFVCLALSPPECEPLPSELVGVIMIKHPNYAGGKNRFNKVPTTSIQSGLVSLTPVFKFKPNAVQET